MKKKRSAHSRDDSQRKIAPPQDPDGAQSRYDIHRQDEPVTDSASVAQSINDTQVDLGPDALFRTVYRLIEDIQRVRLSHGNRIRQVLPLIPDHINPPRGTPSWESFFKVSADILEGEEKRVLNLAKKLLENDPIGAWALAQKGVGPSLAVSILGECWPLDRFANVQKLWAFAGLHVDKEGKAVRRKKGVKSNWNSRLKTRMWLFSTSVLKSGGVWRDLYDHRKAYEYARIGAQCPAADQRPSALDPDMAGAQSSADSQASYVPSQDASGAQTTIVSPSLTAPAQPLDGAQARSDLHSPDAPVDDSSGAQTMDDPHCVTAPGDDELGDARQSVAAPEEHALSKLHLHNRAMRFVQKAMLKDLWRVAHNQEPLVGRIA